MTTPAIFNPFQEATADDVMQDPHKFGLPTLHEFMAAKRAGSNRFDMLDDVMASATGPAGSPELKSVEGSKRFFEFNGVRYKDNEMEKFERVVRDAGYTLKDLEFQGEFDKPHGGGKADVILKFRPRSRIQAV